MKLFISSLITDMGDFRAAAREAVVPLGFSVLMAENFGARPQSPQIACLEGVRKADAVILIVGARYGAKQTSGLSATHEEYRQAKERCPVFVFVQENVTREAEQDEFLTEIQAWGTGFFRAAFSTPENLRHEVTKAIHQWTLSKATGPVDTEEMMARSVNALSQNRGQQNQDTFLRLSITGGPVQQILRPSQIEDQGFAQELQQAALFGSTQLFALSEGSGSSIREHKLVLEQNGRNPRSISLNESGDILITIPLDHERSGLPVLVEEVVQEQLAAGLRYAVWLLDRIDPTERLSHVMPAAAIAGNNFLGWRTRREQQASPNSVSMGHLGHGDRPPVYLTPPHRPRASLRLASVQLIEDFIVLLRRQYK